MSVVCAKIYPDHITIASDSGVYAGDSILPGTTVEKLLRLADDFFIGSSGTVSETQLMKWFAQKNRPEENTEEGIFHFMSEFFEFCAEQKQNFPVDKDNDGEPIPAPLNEYLIVYENKVYYCEGALVSGVSQYAAIGVGSPYALTALSLGHSCRESVEISAKLCAYVHTPVREYNIETSKVRVSCGPFDSDF